MYKPQITYINAKPPTTICIDCEWNGPDGELISMALCALDGSEFYEVLECSNPVEWVAEHVIPVLNKKFIGRCDFTNKLYKFLSSFDSIHIVADRPEDIARFCYALITGSGTWVNTPPLTMQILRIASGINDLVSILNNTKSLLPHNALDGARGILQYVRNPFDL